MKICQKRPSWFYGTIWAGLLLAFPPIALGQAALTTAQIATRVSPSVVVIQGKTESGDFLGSGFIISKDGRIVTNLHVIRDMKTASVHLANGEVFDSVSVLAIDERRDLAVVQIAGFNLPILELGNSDLLIIGEPTVIVGSPRGLEGTVTAGILSSIRDSGEGYKVLQTDAAVNPGNSGGPLLNNKGQAIGVVSFKLKSSEGLNFAIPINYARGLLNMIREPMSLEQMRKGLTIKSPVTNEQSGKPSDAWPQEPNGFYGLNFGATTSEVQKQAALASCSTDSFGDANCSATISIRDKSVKASLTFASDHLTRVFCAFPTTAFDAFLDLFLHQYGSPTYTDPPFGRTWSGKRVEIVLARSPEDMSFFAVNLKSYAAAVRSRNGKKGEPVNTLQSGPSLRETLRWLKEQLPLSTYRYVQRIGEHILDDTVTTAPVSIDSCTAAFDVITSSAQRDGYESRLTEHFTVLLGSVALGAVIKVNNNAGTAYLGPEKWAVALSTGFKVVRYETHRTSTFLLALSGLPTTRVPGDDVNTSDSWDHFDVIFNDESLAHRVLAAFFHAAELCQQ